MKPLLEIPSPANYCREDWKCLVCGAPKEELHKLYPSEGLGVQCGTCRFLYELKRPEPGSKKRYVPRPKYNKKWRDVWHRAWLHFKDSTDTEGFMEGFATPSEANNTMNRLDGGGMIARERASSQPPEAKE